MLDYACLNKLVMNIQCTVKFKNNLQFFLTSLLWLTTNLIGKNMFVPVMSLRTS